MKSPCLSGSETKMDDILVGVLAPRGCGRRLSWGEGVLTQKTSGTWCQSGF